MQLHNPRGAAANPAGLEKHMSDRGVETVFVLEVINVYSHLSCYNGLKHLQFLPNVPE